MITQRSFSWEVLPNPHDALLMPPTSHDSRGWPESLLWEYPVEHQEESGNHQPATRGDQSAATTADRPTPGEGAEVGEEVPGGMASIPRCWHHMDKWWLDSSACREMRKWSRQWFRNGSQRSHTWRTGQARFAHPHSTDHLPSFAAWILSPLDSLPPISPSLILSPHQLPLIIHSINLYHTLTMCLVWF